MWLLSRRLFLSHLVLLFRPFDLIPASVVLFVLLLVPRILLLFWSLKPFLQSKSQAFCLPRPRPPPGCKCVIQLITAVIHQIIGQCGNIIYDWEAFWTPRFKNIFCGWHWPALWLVLEYYVLLRILCLWNDGFLLSIFSIAIFVPLFFNL